MAGVSLASAWVFDGTANQVGLYSNPNLTLGHVGNATINTLIFRTANTDRAWLDSEGRLGIGTNNPAAFHHGANQLVVSRKSANTSAGITIASGSGTYGSLYFANGTNANEQYRGYLEYNHNSNELQVGTAAYTRVRIDGNGLIAIGSHTPTANLDVRGTFAIHNGALSGDTYQRTVIYSDDTYGLLIEAPKNSSGAKQDITFNWRGGGRVPLMMKGSNGFVGIGQSNPQAALDVSGDVKVSGNVHVAGITTKTWTVAPDYVFEKDYKLASLQDVESFVQKNKHLPEVPSAKVIKEKGLDLAEMNLLLLKKVEELTLHAIRQEKEHKTQSRKIRELERQIATLNKNAKNHD